MGTLDPEARHCLSVRPDDECPRADGDLMMEGDGMNPNGSAEGREKQLEGILLCCALLFLFAAAAAERLYRHTPLLPCLVPPLFPTLP